VQLLAQTRNDLVLHPADRTNGIGYCIFSSLNFLGREPRRCRGGVATIPEMSSSIRNWSGISTEILRRPWRNARRYS
jgi:hypothetical protein